MLAIKCSPVELFAFIFFFFTKAVHEGERQHCQVSSSGIRAKKKMKAVFINKLSLKLKDDKWP